MGSELASPLLATARAYASTLIVDLRFSIRCKLSMLTRQKVIDAVNEQIGYEFSAKLQY